MKVRELIDKLSELDPSLEVILTTEDEDVVIPGNVVRPFEIINVSAVNVELSRDEMRRPQIASAAMGEGRTCAILEITADV